MSVVPGSAIKRSDVTDWSTVSWFQDSSLMFDPAQGSLSVFDVPLQGLNVEGVETNSRLPLYRSQGEGTQFAPFSKKTFDVAIEWPQFINALKIVVARKNATLPAPVGASELAVFWGSAWGDPSQWVLLQVEFGQETYNPRVTTTAVEVTGAWHDLFIGPQATALQSVPLTQGFLCSGSTDVLYACGVGHAARSALLGAGWVDVGDSCFHHVGNGACSQAPTCASRGVLCRQNHSIEFLCDCPTPPVGFVSTPSGIFEHDTGVGCL